jgi:hypothetical protein
MCITIINRKIKRIADNYADRPGPSEETVDQRERDEQGRFAPNSYAHNYLDKDKAQRGTSKAYLLERLPESDIFVSDSPLK